MNEPSRRSPLVPLARIATLVALGDLVTKEVALMWVGALQPTVTSVVRFGVVHNDKGAFGLSAGNYTFELSLALTLATLVLIVPVARDLARIDERAATGLGLIAGGAIGNMVSLVLSPAGVIDFIAVQRADGAGIVLNFADVAAYAGVAILLRTGARVISAIRRSRDTATPRPTLDRATVLARLSDVEVVRSVALEPGIAARAGGPARTTPGAGRSEDRSVQLKVVHADRPATRPGRGLAARLRDGDGAPRAPSASSYLRPMSHRSEGRKAP